MPVVLLLPQQRAVHPQQRQSPTGEQLPFSLPGWVSELLKFAGTAYRENQMLERLAVQRALWIARDNQGLSYLAPLTDFQGTADDLHWLFQEMSLGRVQVKDLPKDAQGDIEALNDAYKQQLRAWQVMDQGEQAKAACEVVSAWCDAHTVREIRTWGALPQAPAYDALLQEASQGRTLRHTMLEAEGDLFVHEYTTMQHEVEAGVLQIRDLVAAGVSPEKVAIALADNQGYLPLLQKTLERYRLPWTSRPAALEQQPLGRAVKSVLRVLQGNWTYRDWQLAVQPGWGWPWDLQDTDRTLLNQAKWLKGWPAWKEFLQAQPNWRYILDEVTQWQRALEECNTLAEYVQWLRDILKSYPPERWPSANEQHWAELLKGWDRLHGILDSLDLPDIEVIFSQFCQVLVPALGSERIAGTKNFMETISVGSLEQLAGLEFEQIFVLGLTESAFPRKIGSHWLAGLPDVTPAEQIWRQVNAVAPLIHVSWPKEDAAGREQLPSPILSPFLTERKKPKVVPSYSLAKKSFRPSSEPFGSEEARAQVLHNLTSKPQTISRLNRFLNCPYQYFCQEILGLAQQDEYSEDATALEEGNAVHSILHGFWQTFADEKPPEGTSLTAWLRQAIAEQEDVMGQRLPERLLAALQNFLAYDIETLAPGYKPSFLEYPFNQLKISVQGFEIELRGVIDRIDVNERTGTCVLLDYKTGRNPSPTEVRAGAHLQLPVYYLAIQQWKPDLDPVGVAFYSVGELKRAGLWRKPYHKEFAIGNSSKNLFDDSQWEQVTKEFQTQLEETLERLLEGSFPVEPRHVTNCRYCQYNSICRLEVKA